MSRFMAMWEATGAPRLWLEGSDYAEQLLAGGHAPWLDVAAGIAWQRKMQELLPSDVLTIDVARIATALCAAQPALARAMAEKQRGGYALKTLLADEALRQHLTEWIVALRAALPQPMLCLKLLAPGAAVAQAWQLAHGTAAVTEADEDQIDAAALYQADFLRTFSAAGLDALVLVEPVAGPGAEIQALYQSLLNVATGYQWCVGLQVPGGQDGVSLTEGFSFVIADAQQTLPTAVRVADVFWQTDVVPVAAAVRYARVPPGLQPERVLQRLQVLRG